MVLEMAELDAVKLMSAIPFLMEMRCTQTRKVFTMRCDLCFVHQVSSKAVAFGGSRAG